MRTILLLSFSFTFYILSAQNYIINYHQPSILGNTYILKGEYYKATEYLEICAAQEKVLAPDIYALGICYILTDRITEGKNNIYESYRKGYTSRAIEQDSSFLVSYLSTTEYLSFKDSCILLLDIQDSLDKKKYSKETEIIDQLFNFAWSSAAYYDSIKKEMDSLDYVKNRPKFKLQWQEKLKKQIDTTIDQIGWRKLDLLVEPQNFIWLIAPLTINNIEDLVTKVFTELKKGSVSPKLYAHLYDMLEIKYNGKSRYQTHFIGTKFIKGETIIIPAQRTADSEKELLENDLFQIGLGNNEVRYLKYRK